MRTKALKVETPRGVDESKKPPNGTAENIVNMTYDKMGEWKTCGGFSKISHTTGSHEIPRRTETMKWFATRNGARDFIIAEVKNTDGTAKLVYLKWQSAERYPLIKTLSPADANRPSVISRAYSESPWQKTQYISCNGWLYMINGVDEPLRFDGISLERVGFDQIPAAPIVAGPRQGFKMYDRVYADIARNDPKYAAVLQVGVGITHQKDADAVRPNDTETSVDVKQLCQDRAWCYGYAYSWVNDLGETSPCSDTQWVYVDNISGKSGEPRVQSLAQNASGTPQQYEPTKVCVGITIPKPPADVRGIRLYRTKNVYHKTMLLDDDAEGLDSASIPYGIVAEPSQANLYFHSNHPMGGELQICDTKGDEDLGSKYGRRSKGLYPTGAKYCAAFKGTLFLASRPDYPDRVYYSAPLKFGQFPKMNFFQVGDRDSGAITGMYPTKNAIVVFKRRGIYLIKGDPVVGFQTETLTEDLGCVAPNAIVEVPGPTLQSFSGKPLGLMFLADTGPHVLQGVMGTTGTPTTIEYVGKKIADTWEKQVNKAQLMMSQACVNYRDEEVWIQVPTGADKDAGKTLVYHYNVGAWSFREGYPVLSLCPTQNSQQELFFGGNEDNPGIFVYSHGHDLNGSDINSEYTTSPHQFENRTQILHFEPSLMSYGREVALNIKKDRRVTFERAAADTKKAVDSEYTADKWGTAEWDASKIWYDYKPTPVRFDLHNASQMALTLKATSTKMSLVSYDLHALGKSLNIKKMDVNG